VLVGALIGGILLEYINLVETGWYFPYRPSWSSIAESGLAVIAVSALAAFYPARQAASLVVSDALEYE
jgi:putative ABC transport system permease protein